MPSKKEPTSITAPPPDPPGGEPKPAAGQTYEGRAKSLNTRGYPYQWDEYTFPAGDWVPVAEEHVERLKELPWLTVRKSDGSNG